MEAGFGFFMTISAKDGYFQLSVFSRHRGQSHFVVESLPNRRHVHHGHAASRTRIVSGFQQLLHALKVQHMTAFGNATWFATRVQILQANGTIGA